jgi:hypothetical protein
MMQVPSGSTDRFFHFVAVDSTDFTTRETGLSSFTVRRKQEGVAETAYTTPTVAEISSSNEPGVYSLALDEALNLAAGHDTEEVVLHITQASMAPVTAKFMLVRPKLTEGQVIAVSSGVLGTGVIAAATFAADAISAAALSAAAANKQADHTHRRTYANVRASSNGDTLNARSLFGAVGRMVNKWSIAGSTLTQYHEDDTTAFTTLALTGTTGADPITAVDPA